MKHPNKKTWWDLENKLNIPVSDQGENPDLSESDAKQIRDQPGARIYSGKYTAKCSRCGEAIPSPPGSCMTCPNCGTSFGACG